jgi:hypothetical protein
LFRGLFKHTAQYAFCIQRSVFGLNYVVTIKPSRYANLLLVDVDVDVSSSDIFAA